MLSKINKPFEYILVVTGSPEVYLFLFENSYSRLNILQYNMEISLTLDFSTSSESTDRNDMFPSPLLVVTEQ